MKVMNQLPNLKLDPDDRHVLAAAIKAQAQIIVTYNLKDFPFKILETFEIEAQHPDDFFLNQSSLQARTIFSHDQENQTIFKKISKDS